MLGLILGLIAVWMWFVLVFTDGEDATISAWFLAPIAIPLSVMLGVLQLVIDNLYSFILGVADASSNFERSIYKKG